MNDDLSKIAHWFETNQLTLHQITGKTKFMILGNNHVVKNFNDIQLN